MTSPLVSADNLAGLLAGEPPPTGGRPTLLDVRWELATGPGAADYERGHIPGAVFVDLDRDLAAPPGAGGRHPLPDPGRFAERMRALGVSSTRPVIVYDASTSMSAARAWWLLRHAGHPMVRVLDGGLTAWEQAGGMLQAGWEAPAEPGDFMPRPGSMPVLDALGAAEMARHGVLLDARAPERFRGDSEPIDPVAGHIPGARNHPTTLNLEDSGRFEDPEALRAAFRRVGLSERVRVGVYCGSGVTAAHQVLALELAGVPAALYPGSWSEWIADPARPVDTGP